jgi:hypothetical protein
VEKKEFVLFSDAVENLIHSLPKAVQKAKNLTENEIQIDKEVFSEDLSCFSGVDEKTKKFLMFRNSLVVSTYQSKSYIWIKRYFYDSEKKLWSICRGNFMFSPEWDDFDIILDFLKKYVEFIKNKVKTNNNKPTDQFQLNPVDHDDDGAAKASATATDEQKNKIEKE